MIDNRPHDPGRRPPQPAQPRFYDADYAPPGATNVLNHGWEVYDDQGEHIGSVDQVYDNYFSIAEGYLIHQLVYAPFAAIDHVDIDERKVALNVSRQQIETLGWGRIPEDIGFGTADNYTVGPQGEIYPNESPEQVGRMLDAEGRGVPERPRATPVARPAAEGAPPAEAPEVVEVVVVETVVPEDQRGPNG